MQNSPPAGPWSWLPPLVVAVLTAMVGLSGSNHAVFLMLNHLGHFAGNEWWSNMTILGDGAVALALVLPAIRRSPRNFWAALFGALIVSLCVQIGKHYFAFARPLAALPAGSFFHTGPELRGGTFPSGHTAAIFTLTGVWIMTVSRHYLLRSALLVLATLVGLSRIMVGVHWPLDVLCGMLIGWSAAYVSLRLSTRLGWRTSGIGGHVAGAVLLGIAAGLIFSRHTGYASAFLLQHVVGLACLIAGAHEIYLLRPRRPAFAGWHHKEQKRPSDNVLNKSYKAK